MLIVTQSHRSVTKGFPMFCVHTVIRGELNKFVEWGGLQKQKSSELIGTANFKLTKWEMCDTIIDYPIILDVSFKSGEDGVQYLSGTLDLKVPLGEDSDYNVTMVIKKTKKAKNFSPLYNLYDESTCDALRKYLGEFVGEMQAAAGIERGLCPVPKGTYKLESYALDFKKIAFQSIPEGTIQATHLIRNVKTHEILTCFIAEVENFAN